MQPKLLTLLSKLLLLMDTVLFVLGLTITLLLSVPLLIYRQLVQISAKIFQLDLVRILPSLQALTANNDMREDQASFNIVTWTILDGSLSIETLRQLVEENLILHCKPDGSLEFPEFQQYFAQYGGYLFFKWDRDFHVNNHVRHLEPETVEITEKKLKSIVSCLCSAGWKNKRSMWEIFVTTNYRRSEDDMEKKSALIFRLHHSLADGYSYLNFMVRRLCKANNMVAAAPRIQMPSFSMWETLLMFVTSTIRQPYECVKLLKSCAVEKNPWKLPSGDLLKEFNVVWSSQIPVSRINQIKRKFNVSFQAVLNSVICGAIRRMMKRAGQDIPNVMSAFFPFPLPNHPGGLCVHTNFSAAKLPVGVENPKTRLKIADAMWLQEVRSSARLMCLKIATFGGWLPTALASPFVNHGVAAGVSCFPGIENDIYLDGNKVLEVNFAVGTAKGCCAVSFATLSCFGTLRFVMTIDKTFCSEDMDEYFNECIEKEIRTLTEPAFSL